MRDLEHELANTMGRANDSNGRPREGFFNLTRRMENEEEDQFDVDHTILDFLVYKAVAAVFEWQDSANKWKSDLPNALVTMTAEWRSFLSDKHRGRLLSNTAALRSRLLQFILLLTHRYHPTQTWTNEAAIQALSSQTQLNTTAWLELSDAWVQSTRWPFKHTPKGDATSLRLREQRANELNMPLDTRRWLTNPSERPTLYILLPLFLELTALRTTLLDEWFPSTDWFDLAGQFMLQAVIEEYLLNGATGDKAFNTIFAFGNLTAKLTPELNDMMPVQKLFCEEQDLQATRKEWIDIRQEYIGELFSAGVCSIERAQMRYPYAQFEERVLSFLRYLHNDLAKPDLIQVEEGRINIDGNELSEEETKKAIERMRL